MRRFLALLAVLSLPAIALAADEPNGVVRPPVPPPEDRPRIDVVFCIDCSGSMGPVIEAAKAKVWAIVNEVARAKPSPALRIGLLGYGNADQSYRAFDLSDDLDEVYKNLTTFKDEGWGSEFVGLAVHKATGEFTWSGGRQVLKVIYVVGNETARQGPGDFDYAKTAPAAIAKGIVVNAVYCGDTDYEKATPTWREMAKLADGQYLEISRTGGVVAIDTPYDARLNELSTKLNGTYVAYGAAAPAAAANQVAQDENAVKLGAGTGADRALAKSSGQYDNGRWDAVDAQRRNKDFDITKVPAEQLPEEMRKLTPEERKAYVEQKAKEREAIQAEIKELGAKRAKHIQDEMARQGQTGDKGFEKAVRDSIAKQAEAKGFKFEE